MALTPRISPSGPIAPGGSGATPNLEQVLTEGNDGGALTIENIADPVNPQDAATRAYVLAQIPATPTLAAVCAAGHSAGTQINNVTNPTSAQDADTLSARNTAISAAIAAIPVSTLAAVCAAGNSAGTKITSVTDPTNPQDAATKNYVDTRPAPNLGAVCAVGTAAGTKITSVTDPTNPQDAATKNYVDTRAAPSLGAVCAVGTAAGTKLTSVTDPTAAQDAATKNYVDNAMAGFLGVVTTASATYNPTRAVDLGNLILTSSGTAQSIALPSDSTDNWPIGKVVAVRQGGAGLATFTAGSGATIQGTLVKCARQYGMMFAVKVAANTWGPYGEVTA